MGSIVIASAIFSSICTPTGRFGGVTAPVRDDAGAAARLILSGGICFSSLPLVGRIRLQQVCQRLRKGATDVGPEDDFKVFNPLEFAKLYNRPTGSSGSRTKELKTD